MVRAGREFVLLARPLMCGYARGDGAPYRGRVSSGGRQPCATMLRDPEGYKSLPNSRRHLGFEKQSRPTLHLAQYRRSPFRAVLLAARP